MSTKVSQKKLCFYPFVQMVLDPMGNTQPCCWLPDYHVGNIQENSLLEIWNSPKMVSLRKEFLDGKPKTCASKMKEISCHETSHFNYAETTKLKIEQSETPKRFDLRLNGQCNLQCVMCNVWEMPNGLYTEENFWGPGRKTFFQNLQELIVLGGEPFIQRDTYKLINEVSSINPRCLWGFITNGQYELNSKIIAQLEKIRIRFIQVSLDSLIPEKYSAIRKGGELSRAMKTLQGLISLSQERAKSGASFVVSVAMCVQKRNVEEIETFILFSKHMNFELGIQFVAHPEHESLLSLPKSQRLKIMKKVELLMQTYKLSQLSAVTEPLRASLQ